MNRRRSPQGAGQEGVNDMKKFLTGAIGTIGMLVAPVVPRRPTH